MILIKDISIVKTQKNQMELLDDLNIDPCIKSFGRVPKEKYTYEMVQGRIFINSNGEDVCIGMSKQVQKLIGLPFEAYENMLDTIYKQNKIIDAISSMRDTYLKRLLFIENMNLWDRIKFVFRGNK